MLSACREKLRHADPATRRQALAALFLFEEKDFRAAAEDLLAGADPELSGDLLFYLLSRDLQEGTRDYLLHAFCRVEAGRFLFGPYEHMERLDLGVFSIQKHPVTNREYSLFLKEHPVREKPSHWEGTSYPPHMENHPVVHVSFEDAEAYCQYMGARLKVSLRLPSEQEWERAARGTQGFMYPWGNAFKADLLNHKGLGLNRTTVVGSFAGGASPCGCMDMAGNVIEWTETDYDASSKILKGGGWFNDAEGARADIRYDMPPRLKSALVGFRTVWDQRER